MSRLRFRPPWWAWLITVPGIALMLQAAHWQWERGQWKAALIEKFLAADAGPARPLDVDETPNREEVRKRRARGTYLPDRQLLLDNQSLHRRPGYHVWTPLRLENGDLVMVNRGWIAAPSDRSRFPALDAPEGLQEIEGFWQPFPRPGLSLQREESCQLRAFPHLVQYPQLAELACLYPGERIANGLLLLSPAVDGGFAREWNVGAVEVTPEKHYGYALQWLAFALTALALFIKLNLKRSHDSA